MHQDLQILIIIFKDSVVLHKKKESLTLNKLIFVGCTVLELSKLATYEFYYNFLKKRYKNVKLLYLDTGSFIIEITDENCDEIMFENNEFFDLSNYSKDCKCYCGDNKKVPGKMKDQYGGTTITEFAASKPKSYKIIDANKCEKSVHKGYNSIIRSNKFKDVINNKKVVRHKMKKYNLKIIKCILKKIIKYLYLVLMIKGILKTIE